MCRECWALVPADLAREVYRTVKLRGALPDATWAPWWRAQGRAVAHVAHVREPNEPRREAYLKRVLEIADKLELRTKSKKKWVVKK